MADINRLEGPAHRDSHAESPRSVLVPLDGSPASATVIPVARTIAEILGSTIHLLHIADPPLSPQALLDALHFEPGAVRGLVVSSASGPPAEAIVAFAEAHPSHLIAMSTQGWTADPNVALGSVAEEVLRRTMQPLLLVRPQVGAQWANRPDSLSRILVPLDGTPRTAGALGPAAELAQRSGAALDVLHVVVPRQVAPEEPGAMTVPRYTDQPAHAWPLGSVSSSTASVNASRDRPSISLWPSVTLGVRCCASHGSRAASSSCSPGKVSSGETAPALCGRY
jgi:nucleotide-binding universal stress UspA family protein